MHDHPADPLIDQVLNAAFEVANTLGPGFLESVYHNALYHELTARQIPTQSEPHIQVLYKSHPVGDYRPDLLIDNTLLLELKCVESFHPAHLAQCINYLRITGLHVCLLLNFQNRHLEIKRVIL